MVDKLSEKLITALSELKCGDNSCHFNRPDGMGTNGGCRCLKSLPANVRLAMLKIWYEHKEELE